MVAILNPPRVDTYLTNSATAILTSSRPLVLLKDNLIHPNRPIKSTGTDASGFVLNGVEVTTNQVAFYDIGCHGSLCNQQSLLNGDIVLDCCSCFQMNKTEKVMTVWDVTMMTTDGNSIGCKFISKSFMKDLFIRRLFL